MTAVLIPGTTGRQGGAIIRNLILRKAPCEILAGTRDPSSSSAQKLAKLSMNIKLVKGDLDHPAVIFHNARRLTQAPIWGVYSVQGSKSYRPSPQIIGLAIGRTHEQGRRIPRQSPDRNSVDRGDEDRSFNNPTNIPHFMRKHNIEHHLVDRTKDGNMDWVILRLTAFFENLTPGFLGKVFATCCEMALTGKPLQLVATSDINFSAPKRSPTRSSKTGQPLSTTFRPVCFFIMAVMKDVRRMFKWFREEGYKANIQSLRKINPETKDFGTWLEKESGFR